MDKIETDPILKPADELKTLRQISLIFFFIIGGTHILTGLFISQNMLMPLSNIINRVLDIPFALIGLVYGLSHTKLAQDSPYRKYYYYLMIFITLLVLAVMLYINFLPDRIS